MTGASDRPDSEARSYTRSYREEAAIVLSALDCVLNGQKAVYVSSDLTTGQRFYGLLREFGAADSTDLRRKLGDDAYHRSLFEPNSAAANAFALRIRQRLGGTALVITPAPLTVPGWGQEEYLGFFETVILTRVSSVFFNDGWEYSNGCTFEFVAACRAGLPTFDADHRPLGPGRALELIERAAGELETIGITPIGLRRHQALLQEIDRLRSTERDVR